MVQKEKSQIQRITVPIKFLSNFWRLLEIALTNCKIHLKSKPNKNFILSSVVKV